VGVVMVAVPETTDHTPVPTAGVLPANVAVVTPQAGFMSEPAAAVVSKFISSFYFSKHPISFLIHQ